MTSNEKFSTADFISAFLVRFKIPLILTGVLIIVALIGVAVSAVVIQNATEANAAVAEEIADAYAEWVSAGEEDKAEAESVLTAAIEKGKAEKQSSYAFVRAVLCESQMAETKGDQEGALAALSVLKEIKAVSLYLIPIALHRAAVLAEDLKQPSEALTYYRSIEKNYAKSYFNMDRVYYNIARLEETLGNTDAAKTAYRLLIETAGNKEVDSPLVSVAKDRLIYLESADLDNQEEAPNEETVAAE